MSHCLTCFTFPLALAACFCLFLFVVLLLCCVLGWFLFCVFSSCFASAWGCFDLYPRVLDDRQCFIARSAMRKKKRLGSAGEGG